MSRNRNLFSNYRLLRQGRRYPIWPLVEESRPPLEPLVGVFLATGHSNDEFGKLQRSRRAHFGLTREPGAKTAGLASQMAYLPVANAREEVPSRFDRDPAKAACGHTPARRCDRVPIGLEYLEEVFSLRRVEHVVRSSDANPRPGHLRTAAHANRS